MPFWTLAGLAASLAGTAAQSVAAQQQQDAMNQKVAEELLRQQEYQKQAQSAWDTSLAAATPKVAQQELAKGEANRLAEYQKAQAVPLQTVTPAYQGKSQNVVQQRAAGHAQMSAAQMAKLGAYNDWELQQMLKNLEANRRLATISSLAGMSSNTLPMELSQARQSAGTLSGVGQTLSGAGSLMSAYGNYLNTPAAKEPVPETDAMGMPNFF